MGRGAPHPVRLSFDLHRPAYRPLTPVSVDEPVWRGRLRDQRLVARRNSLSLVEHRLDVHRGLFPVADMAKTHVDLSHVIEARLKRYRATTIDHSMAAPTPREAKLATSTAPAAASLAAPMAGE